MESYKSDLAWCIFGLGPQIMDIITENLACLAVVFNELADGTNKIEEKLRQEKVRVNDHPNLGKPIPSKDLSIRKMSTWLKNVTHVLCILADIIELEQGPAATDEEKTAIKDCEDILRQLKLDQKVRFPRTRSLYFDLLSEYTSRRAQRLNNVCQLITRRICSTLRNRSCESFKTVCQEVFHCTEVIEKSLQADGVRVREDPKLGDPCLSDDPKIRELLQRLNNTVRVLCALVDEVEDKGNATAEELQAIAVADKALWEAHEQQMQKDPLSAAQIFINSWQPPECRK